MSAATISTSGRGATVSVSLASGTPNYVLVSQVKSISFSGPKASYADVTNLSSPGAVSEFVPTVIEPGDATLMVVWNQTDPGALLLDSSFYAQTLLSVKVQYPPQAGLTNGPVRTFNAYVAENSLPSLDITKANEYTIRLKLSGVITETAGS